MTAPCAKAPSLQEKGVNHGFFGRAGGVSTGVYATLNVGLGSEDDAEAVAENRNRCRHALNAEHLLSLYQVHSADAVIVDEPWVGAGPRADGMATRLKGVALGVLTADCMPFVFIDEEAGVIGAAHAGWRGALSGVLEATIGAMTSLGARAECIHAALGPCLRQANFEVGLDLLDAFTDKYPQADQFFAPGASDQKRQLDLAGFGRWRLREIGVGQLDDLGICTLAAPHRYFSFRASQRAGDADYGRNLSAISL
jgi:YfiH family protein